MANMNRDYYADLGVGRSASVEEIRAVYRALAKIYHPDVNKDKAATEKFRLITEAYEVLSDPEQRAAYDGQSSGVKAGGAGSSTPRREGSSNKPSVPVVECSSCGKPTAQPRFLVFRQVMSFVLVTSATPKSGVFCSKCAQKTALRCTLISAIMGWWGFPWGPIYTLRYGLGNAFGGENVKSIEEELLWQNAVAFGTRGNLALAGSLADRLVHASDRNIAESAIKLKRAVEADGVGIKPLKSPWGLNIGAVAIHVGALAVVPVVLFLLIVQGSSSRSQATQFNNSYGTPTTTHTNTTNGPVETELVDFCSHHPANGTVLLRRYKLSNEGHILRVKNGSDADSIVKMRDADTGRTVYSFFVRRGMSASLQGFPDGQYRMQFASGVAMAKDCKSFLDASASEFSNSETFRTEETATQISWQSLDLTLYPVVNGNAHTNGVNTTDFNTD